MRKTWLQRHAFIIFLVCSGLFIFLAIRLYTQDSSGDAGDGNVSSVRIDLQKHQSEATQLNSGEQKPISAEGKAQDRLEVANADDNAEEPLPDWTERLKKLQWQAAVESPERRNKHMAPPPASSAEGSFGSPDIKSQFVQAVRRHLNRFKRPQLAEGNPTTWVEFELNRDGKLLRTSLFRSSGYEVLDAAALQTFARAQPFPRIPAGMENQIILIMGFDFNVSLNQ